MPVCLRNCVIIACEIKKKSAFDPLGWLVASDVDELSCVTVVGQRE